VTRKPKIVGTQPRTVGLDRSYRSSVVIPDGGPVRAGAVAVRDLVSPRWVG